MLVGVSLWLVVQQAHQRDAMEADLKELAGLQESARWSEARAALERATAQLGGGGPDDQRRRLSQARRDLDLMIHLDNIRLKRVTRGELSFYKARANRDYAEAFQHAGLGTSHDQPSSVAARINASGVRRALWRQCTTGRSAPPTSAMGLAARGRAANRLKLGRLARARSPSSRMGESTGAGRIGRDCAGGARAGLTAAGARGTAEGDRRERGPFIAAGTE